MSDISITAANVVKGSGAITQPVIYGESGITQGMSLYENTTDGKYYKADCDDTAAKANASAIALSAGGANQPGIVQIAGDINPGGTVVVGEIYVLSGNAGGIAPKGDLASGDYVTIVGVGITASNLRLRFLASGVQVPA